MSDDEILNAGLRATCLNDRAVSMRKITPGRENGGVGANMARWLSTGGLASADWFSAGISPTSERHPVSSPSIV